MHTLIFVDSSKEGRKVDKTKGRQTTKTRAITRTSDETEGIKWKG